jgi:hypothetical protein
MLDRRKRKLVFEGPAQLALPGYGHLLQESGEQVKLFIEQFFILAQVETEQREGFGERTASEDHLGAAVRDRIQAGEALKHAHGIVRAQDRHGRAEPDPPGARGDRRQHHFGRGDREIGAMVLADTDEVDAKLIG